MDKFFGAVGYVQEVETAPSVYKVVEAERDYYGDVLRDNRKLIEPSDKLNRDVSISNRISIVCDEFAYENYLHIRYVVYMNVKWTVTDIEVQYPRLILSLGGKYNP